MDSVCLTPHFALYLQWVVLTRKHAKVVVEDDTVFPMFQQHCRVSNQKNCYMDVLLHIDCSFHFDRKENINNVAAA